MFNGLRLPKLSFSFLPNNKVDQAPSNKIAPAPLPLSTDNLKRFFIADPLKPKNPSTASNTSGSDSPVSVRRKPIIPPLPKMMHEIHQLQLIEHYAKYYINQVDAESAEDENAYQHNLLVILEMIKLGKDVIELPQEKDRAKYIEDIIQYDEQIEAARKHFNLKSKKIRKHIPTPAGEKSELLAYVYLQYYLGALNRRPSPKKGDINSYRKHNREDVLTMYFSLKKKITFQKNDAPVIQMENTLNLRKARLIELRHPHGSLEIEKQIMTLSTEAKRAWFQETAQIMNELNTHILNEIKDNPKKFPGAAKSQAVTAQYLEDLLYRQEPERALFIVRCSDEDFAEYKRIRSENKITRELSLSENESDNESETANIMQICAEEHDKETDSEISSNQDESDNESDTANIMQLCMEEHDSENSSEASYDEDAGNNSETENSAFSSPQGSSKYRSQSSSPYSFYSRNSSEESIEHITVLSP